MFRLLFVMITTVLLGIGSGYFLWGSRVARLTESLSGLTLELDTMREKLASPRAESAEGGIRSADELRVINESIAAFRQELANQKALIESQAAAAVPADAASANAELRTVRNELAGCIADKQDLERRCPAGGAPPSAVPGYRPEPTPTYRPPVAPTPPAPARPPGNDLSDPRF
ncbi:MAG: hypothetical protein ABR587_05985 [Candidatus Binatia bacterium]